MTGLVGLSVIASSAPLSRSLLSFCATWWSRPFMVEVYNPQQIPALHLTPPCANTSFTTSTGSHCQIKPVVICNVFVLLPPQTNETPNEGSKTSPECVSWRSPVPPAASVQHHSIREPPAPAPQSVALLWTSAKSTFPSRAGNLDSFASIAASRRVFTSTA